MSELTKRRNRTQLLLLLTAAIGCTCASVSGTLTALFYGAAPDVFTSAGRSA